MSEQPYPVHFEPGERKSIVCPQCRTMRRVMQNLIVRHDAVDGLADCAGSFQRVVFDVTAQQERELYAARSAGLAPDRTKTADAPLRPVDAARRAAEILRTQMRTGRLRPGQPVPPTAEIAQRLRTDENAVRYALTMLRDEQLLVTSPVGGSVVSTRATALAAEAAAQHAGYRVRPGLPEALAMHQLAAARTVADLLRTYMRSGRLRPGHKLPCTETLARWFSTSESAVRYALNLLHDQELITISPGQSVRVSAAAPRVLKSAA